MSDTTDANGQDLNADAGQDPNVTASTDGDGQDPKPTGFDALPEDTKAEIRKLRRQNAEFRKRADEIEARQRAADEAKARDEGKFKELLEAREKELADLRADIARRDLTEKRRAVARTYGLPDDLADRLVGDTDEEMEADAKRLAKLFAREDGPDTDSGKRSAPGKQTAKNQSLLASYDFARRR